MGGGGSIAAEPEERGKKGGGVITFQVEGTTSFSRLPWEGGGASRSARGGGRERKRRGLGQNASGERGGCSLGHRTGNSIILGQRPRKPSFANGR